MIEKELKVPLNLLQYMALKRRISPNHPRMPMIDQALNKLKTGFKGEQAIEYQLRYLDQKRYLIFHDVRLPIHNTHFQMDFLLLSPSFYTIIEVKNIGGTLYFDPTFKQLIRRKADGTEVVFMDPTLQVKRQQERFNENKLETSPLRYLIGIADSNRTILKTSLNNHHINKWIVHNWAVASKIEEFAKLYPKDQMQMKDLRKISRKILKQHEPLTTDLLEHYNISLNELIKGVQCPSCKRYKMEWKRAKWICSSCLATSKTAHHAALADYGLLINQTFKNIEVREFLWIPPHTAHHLLNKLELNLNGRKYTLTKTNLYELADKEEYEKSTFEPFLI